MQKEIGDVIWYSFSLAPELSESRHEVVGCRVKILPSSWLHRSLWRLFYLPRNAWRWRRLYPAYATVASYLSLFSWPFLKTLFRDKPDFLFATDYASGRFDVLLLIARMLGVPLVAYHAGSRPEQYVGRVVKRWSIPRADRLIVSSCKELEMLAGLYHVSRGHLTVILTPVDTNVYRPMDRTASCRSFGLDPARHYFLFMGRLDDRVKRLSAIIRSFSNLAPKFPEADLLITGEGPDGEMLRELAQSLAPGRIHFLGWISEPDRKVALYNGATCLLLPSLSEGFPTVVGEAMACGTPVLASRVGGVSELVVEGRTGWLLPPGDDAALQAGLAFVLTHPEAVTSMRPQARAMAEARVSPPVVADALRQCFSFGKHPAYGVRESCATAA